MKNWSSIVVLILLIGFFCLGYRIHAKFNPCPEITTDTIYKVDTIERTIIDRIPYYIQRTDSVVYRDTVFKDVDTIAILTDYFAIHYFTQTWRDSLISASEEIAIAENSITDSRFTYKILRPQTVIQNIINEEARARSIYAGFSLPVAEPKYLELDAIVTYPRLYFGAGYSPGMKSITLKAGAKIFDF
jgi:hypothetical protein